jgi:HEAT repeat protein
VEAPEWQVRVGAARGLAAAPPDVAVPPLVAAVEDAHADVRKAAVIALVEWADRRDVAEALERAGKDPDADVRGYARRALRERTAAVPTGA